MGPYDSGATVFTRHIEHVRYREGNSVYLRFRSEGKNAPDLKDFENDC